MRPIALAADVEQLAARAHELACAAVVVLPPLVATARARLGRGPLHVVAAVGLPFGAEGAKATAATCAQAVADGADVLDVVASLPLLANGDFPAARDELAAAVAAAGGAAPAGRHIVVRAVIETCYLEPAAWRLAARLVGLGRLRRRRLRHGARPRGRDAGGDRGAARRAAGGQRRQGAGRHPLAGRCAARAGRGRRPAGRRRSGEPARRSSPRPPARGAVGRQDRLGP